METHANVPLKNFTTMRLGGPASQLVEVRSVDELVATYRQAKAQSTSVFILGGGSNVVAHDEGFAGLVIRIRIPGFETVADDLNTTTIKVGAGEDWDDTVKRIVDMRLGGMEALSGVPGTTGAAPVQNIGAYGQEVAETIISVEAYDTQTDSLVALDNASCGFAYRHSIFRGEATGRYIITSVTFKLSKNLPQPPFYDAVQAYFDAHAITTFTHQTVRDAVLAIRSDKLPDPTVRPNSGSFFKNAIIESWLLTDLQTRYPDIKTYEMGDGRVKVPSGWLIEQAGLKGQLLHGIRVHDKNTLVLINESATSYNDLAAARDHIISTVRDMFGITIEQEPLEIPTR